MDRDGTQLKNPTSVEHQGIYDQDDQALPLALDSDGELQGVVFCLFCGSLNPFGDETCQDCGQALPELSTVLQGELLCFVCGSPNDVEGDLCLTCGAPLDERRLERRMLMARIGEYASHAGEPHFRGSHSRTQYVYRFDIKDTLLALTLFAVWIVIVLLGFGISSINLWGH